MSGVQYLKDVFADRVALIEERDKRATDVGDLLVRKISSILEMQLNLKPSDIFVARKRRVAGSFATDPDGRYEARLFADVLLRERWERGPLGPQHQVCVQTQVEAYLRLEDDIDGWRVVVHGGDPMYCKKWPASNAEAIASDVRALFERRVREVAWREANS